MGKIAWVVVISAGVFIGLFACVSAVILLPNLIPKTTYDIEYFVTSPGRMSLTYNNENGDTEQAMTSTVSNVWTKFFTAKSGALLYVSAQTDGNSVECTISANGKLFKQSQSSGPHSITTCSGKLP